MNWLTKLVLPRVLATTFADIRGMEDTIRAFGLDWTLVRASQLTDGPLTRHYRVAPDFTPRGGRKISHFIEATLTDGGWLKVCPRPRLLTPAPAPAPRAGHIRHGPADDHDHVRGEGENQ
jgi:NAD(P)H-binding